MVPPSRAPVRAHRLRALNAPQAIGVAWDITGGLRTPRQFQRSAEGFRTVSVIHDTWRLEDEWWRDPVARQYWDVTLADGAHVVLFEELHVGRWFLQQP